MHRAAHQIAAHEHTLSASEGQCGELCLVATESFNLLCCSGQCLGVGVYFLIKVNIMMIDVPL